VGDVISVVG